MIFDDKRPQDIKGATTTIGTRFGSPHRRFVKGDDETGDTNWQSLLFPTPTTGTGTIETLLIAFKDGANAISTAMLFCQGRKVEPFKLCSQ